MARRVLKEHLINDRWCKGCGICVALCAKQVLEMNEHEKVRSVRPLDCVVCRLCEMRCPDLAIEVVAEEV